MFKKIYNEIVKADKIIILRHKGPDYDAYGSQIGLYYSLKKKFPKKTIYVYGDENANNPFDKRMDNINKEDYTDSIVIIVDTSCAGLMIDENYKLAKKVIVLDHHDNIPEMGDITYMRSDYSSAAELVTEFLYKSKIAIPKEAADYLYLGIAGDSNRFYYRGTSSNTFKMASILIDSGADIQNIYKLMQKDEKENERHFRGYVLSNFKTYDKVAYCYISKDIRDEYGVSDSFASRGCVNLLSGIENIEAILNFTEGEDGSTVYVEFRSKNIPVMEIAKKYGGGGHLLACGCRIQVGDDYMNIVKEVNAEVSK